MAKVLIVDDDAPTLRRLCEMAESNSHEVHMTYSGNEAIQMIEAHGNTFDRILTDTKMEDGDGIDLLSWLYQHRAGPNRPLTHIHSSVDQCIVDGIIVELPEYIPKTFGGTGFGIKNLDYTSATDFLKRDISSRRSRSI